MWKGVSFVPKAVYRAEQLHLALGLLVFWAAAVALAAATS